MSSKESSEPQPNLFDVDPGYPGSGTPKAFDLDEFMQGVILANKTRPRRAAPSEEDLDRREDVLQDHAGFTPGRAGKETASFYQNETNSQPNKGVRRIDKDPHPNLTRRQLLSADLRTDLKPGLPRLERAPEGAEAQPLPLPQPEPTEADKMREAYENVAPFIDPDDIPPYAK